MLAHADYLLTAVASDADPGFWFGPHGLPLITSEITIMGNGATIRRSPEAPPFRLFAVAGAGQEVPGSTG